MDFDDYGYYNYGVNPGHRGIDFDFDGSSASGMSAAINLGMFAGIFTVVGIYAVIVWIFRSIGLYHLAKDRGIQHAWFAWIPILHFYIIGRLINDKVVLGDSIVTKHAEFFLPFLSLLAVSSMPAGPIGSIIATAIWVYRMSALWRLFKIYRPKSRVSYTIWSAILGSGFFIFAIRNDRPYDPLEPEKQYENFYAQKRVVQDYYDDVEAKIRERESREKVRLKNEYDALIARPDLTEEDREKIDNQYHAQLNRIENEAERQINQEKTRERADIFNLDKNKPEEVDNTDVYTQNIEREATQRQPDITVKTSTIEEDIYIPKEEEISIPETKEEIVLENAEVSEEPLEQVDELSNILFTNKEEIDDEITNISEEVEDEE